MKLKMRPKHMVHIISGKEVCRHGREGCGRGYF